MECRQGDWIETPTTIGPVMRVLERDLVEVYDFERHTPQIVATQRGCTLLACGCDAPQHDKEKQT